MANAEGNIRRLQLISVITLIMAGSAWRDALEITFKRLEHIEHTTFHSIVFHLTTVTSIAVSIGNSAIFIYKLCHFVESPVMNTLISHKSFVFSGTK